MTFYNEFDAKPAAWLKELAKQGHISEGVVNETSIKELRGADVAGYERAHFFAGIGGWDYALQLAGWPAGYPVWTGSCPCQPFSSAGAGKGTADPRHLWPDFARLIGECRPPVVFGEQVASPAGRDWLAGVRSDLEGMGYDVGAADLCAAGVGAPHIRQRLYWVGALPNAADTYRRSGERSAKARTGPDSIGGGRFSERGAAGVELVHPEHPGLEGHPRNGHAGHKPGRECEKKRGPAGSAGLYELLCHAPSARRGERGDEAQQGRGRYADGSSWARFDLLRFRDGKTRRIESGLEPLAYGPPARMGRLRGYGNAIVPQVAACFIASTLEYLRQA